MKKSAQRRPGRRILIGWSHYFISNEKNIPVTLIDFELMSTLGPAQTSHFKHAKFKARNIYCSRSFVIASAQFEIPWFPADIFFLSILMSRRSRVNEARFISSWVF